MKPGAVMSDCVLDRKPVALELLMRLEYLWLDRHVGEWPRGIHGCECNDVAGRNDLILQDAHLIFLYFGDGEGPAFSGGSRDRRRLLRGPVLGEPQFAGALSHPAA